MKATKNEYCRVCGSTPVVCEMREVCKAFREVCKPPKVYRYTFKDLNNPRETWTVCYTESSNTSFPYYKDTEWIEYVPA